MMKKVGMQHQLERERVRLDWKSVDEAPLYIRYERKEVQNISEAQDFHEEFLFAMPGTSHPVSG